MRNSQGKPRTSPAVRCNLTVTSPHFPDVSFSFICDGVTAPRLQACLWMDRILVCPEAWRIAAIACLPVEVEANG